MQINPMLIRDHLLADPAQALARIFPADEETEENDAIVELPDDLWASDSVVLQTMLAEALEGSDHLLAGMLTRAFAGQDDVGICALPEAEGVLVFALSAASCRAIDVCARTDAESVRDELLACEPADDEVTSTDVIEMLDQWLAVLRMAADQDLALIAHQG